MLSLRPPVLPASRENPQASPQDDAAVSGTLTSSSEALVSPRTMLIIFLALLAGTVIGLGSGLVAGIAAKDVGPLAASVIGCLVGLGSAITSGLTIAGLLNRLISRTSN